MTDTAVTHSTATSTCLASTIVGRAPVSGSGGGGSVTEFMVIAQSVGGFTDSLRQIAWKSVNLR